MPAKPKAFTPVFPQTIADGLNKYSNQRSVNALCLNVNTLNQLNWPLPLWVDPMNIRVGFWNTYHYKKWFESWPNAPKFKGFSGFDWLWVPALGSNFSPQGVDKILLQVFDTNLKYFQRRLLANALLQDKQPAIRELTAVYKAKQYNATISLVFPLIDFAVRKLLRTVNLNTSVTKICNLFKACGFDFSSINQLLPNVAVRNFIDAQSDKKLFEVFDLPEFKALNERLEKFNFGIIGAALNSFLWFSNSYYRHYSDDTGAGAQIINRHAILHGSAGYFSNRTDAVKLLSYLYLLLELEPILDILFDDNQVLASDSGLP